MSRVEVRLEELQEAARRFNTSANRVREAIQNVNDLVDGIMALGYESAASIQVVVRFKAQRSRMEEWLDQLEYFGGRLQDAADELAAAMIKAPTGSMPSIRPPSEGTRRVVLSPQAMAHMLKVNQDIDATLDALDPAPEPPPPVEHSLDAFISETNREVYDQLAQAKDEGEAGRITIQQLVTERADIASELHDLETRLRSFDPNVDVDSIARVQALRDQVAGIDAQISSANARLAEIETRIDDLATRLERVSPGAGADLELIQHLMVTATPEHIRTSTEGCVQYIANRMTIPDGIPLDAHLWDEQAERFIQYGITRGDEPLVGSVLVMETAHEYADDLHGHLMYVERVVNGEVWVTDNYHPGTPVRLSDITTEISGANIKYLYFPWHTQA